MPGASSSIRYSVGDRRRETIGGEMRGITALLLVLTVAQCLANVSSETRDEV